MNMDKALKQLISIKREAVEQMRRDVMTLNRLVDSAIEHRGEAEAVHVNFIENIRHAEETSKALTANAMNERRRYLTHLRGIYLDSSRVFEEVNRQREEAQMSFNQKFTELRALERLAERRAIARHKEQLRSDYLVADDTEIARSIGREGEHP